MVFKVAVSNRFQFKAVPSFRTMLFPKEGEIHYIGGADILPAPLDSREEARLIGLLGTEQEKEAKAADNKEDKKETTKIENGDSLVIKTDDLSEDAAFYPIEVDGTEMEVIAVKDSEGNIRTAFNTCQICYDSGNGYYEQEGDTLVCQNCGNSFTMDQVGETAGGCNPYPIMDDDKTVAEDKIQISYDFLKESSDIFTNWKRKQNLRILC